MTTTCGMCPEEVLELFRASGICVGELEERLILGDVVYGD